MSEFANNISINRGTDNRMLVVETPQRRGCQFCDCPDENSNKSRKQS